MSSGAEASRHCAEGQPPLAPSLVPRSTMSMIGDDATIHKADGSDFMSSLRDTFKTVVNFNFFSSASSEHTESDENLMRLDVIDAILSVIQHIRSQPQVGEITSIGNTGTITQSGPEIPQNQAQPLEITNIGNSNDPARTITGTVHNQEQPEAGAMSDNHTAPRLPLHGAVDVIDIVPSDPCSLPVPASIANKYTRCMMKHLAGYPLYKPQPFSDLSEEYLIEGIRAGDVGYIREDGTFDFLFNICPSQNGSINPPDLPNNFSLQESQDSKLRHDKPFAPKTHLLHEPVSRAEGLLGCHEYTCSGAGGAILDLPEGASQFEAINIRPFRDFARCQGVDWYRYTLLRGRDLTKGSLYLVTSSTKCTHWGIAVLMEPCAKRQGLQFVHNRSIFRSYASTSVAPTPDPHHRNALNQCVFLRGYKIMLREDIWNDLDEERRRENFNLAMSPSLLPQTGNTMRQAAPSNQAQYHQSKIKSDTRPGSRTSGHGTDGNEHREDSINPDLLAMVPPVTETACTLSSAYPQYVHPSDLINISLLNQEPNAKLAITHDDVWCDLLRDISNSKTLDFARIAQSYTSLIDEYGCVYFEKTAFNTSHGNQTIGDQQQVPATSDRDHKSIVQMPEAHASFTSQAPTSENIAEPGSSDSLFLLILQFVQEMCSGAKKNVAPPSSLTSSAVQAPTSKDIAEPGGSDSLFLLILQFVQEMFSGAKKNVALPSSLTSSANSFVDFSKSTTIDLANNELTKTLQEYACQITGNKDIDNDKAKATKDKMNRINKPIDNKGNDETTYVQSVGTFVDGRSYPEPSTVFEHLLSGQTPRAHPNGISSIAFAFLSILSLSLNRDDPNQLSLKHNSTSSYFDLSPLYGSNDTKTGAVRAKDGTGMLWNDCFFEDRLDMLPDAVPALLILWNRFHNHVAKYLLWRNDKDKDGNNKWKDPSEIEEGSPNLLSQDDQIFNIARSITCINFMNIIKEDILKGLFGLPFVGPSIEVDILHDVRGKNETRIGHCSTMEAYFLYDFSSFMPPSMIDKQHGIANAANRDLRPKNDMGLSRNKNGYFDDGDLTGVLFDAIESSAGSPGARNISTRERERVVRKIKQGQKWNVCTLNEFREALGLKRLKSFSEWNSDSAIARATEALYENIDNLELYPGLLAEEPIADGAGFGFGRTMTWGLITDIVTRIRSDPRFTVKFKEEELTKWGYRDCTTSPQDPFNTGMPKLLHRTLLHNFPYTNVYSLFPFTVPTSEKARIEGFINQAEAKHDLDFSRPKNKVKVLRTIEGIREVFNDPDRFPSPYKQNLYELTGGYGHVLGFDDLTLHDHDLMLILFALFPDKGAAKCIAAAFGEKTGKYLRDRYTRLRDKRVRINIVEDVIDATCVSWVSESIYGFRLQPKRKERRKLGDDGTKKYAKEKETEAREDFAACYAYIFHNREPEIGLQVRARALKASKMLHHHLEKKLRKLKHDKGENENWAEFVQRIWQELHTGKILPRCSTRGFLDRLMKAAEMQPLRNLDEVPYFGEPETEYQKPYQKVTDPKKLEQEASDWSEMQRDTRRFLDHTMKATEMHPLRYLDEVPYFGELKTQYRKSYPKGTDPKKLEQEANDWLEMQRVIANAIVLSVFISVHFAKVCAQAINFYLDEKHAEERTKLVALCTNKASTNEEIIGYIREAQRIGQRFGLWRDVNLQKSDSPIVIKQGHGHPDVIIEEGDRVFADFSFAHNDPNQIENPGSVNPNRRPKVVNGSEQVGPYEKINSLQGLGVHKCPAGAFIDETMAEMFRVIFSQKNLSRAKENGCLSTATLHPIPAPWDPEVYLDDEWYSFCPRKLMLEFEVEESTTSKKSWEFTYDWVSFSLNWFLIIVEVIIGIIVFVLILVYICIPLAWWFYNSVSSLMGGVTSLSQVPASYWSNWRASPQLSADSKLPEPECKDPKEIVPYTINSFRPKWFGLFGEPTPIIYHTPEGNGSYEVSIVAIDKRDFEMRYWVNETEYTTNIPITLNASIECGEDVEKCLDLGFSAALLYIPRGAHTFKAEILQHKNRTFKWGLRRRWRVMMKVDECL